MSQIEEKELKNIIAGSISASFITAIVRGINSVLDLGRSLGTAIRRITTGQKC